MFTLLNTCLPPGRLTTQYYGLNHTLRGLTVKSDFPAGTSSECNTGSVDLSSVGEALTCVTLCRLTI